MSYRIRFLRGSLELSFPEREVEVPTAPAQVGALVVMALSAGREVSLETFKVRLYDCDPADVSNIAIQTPITRLRQAGLPIPQRRYLLEVPPAAIDVVDVDRRFKVFIEAANRSDGLGPEDIAALAKQGLELHGLWEEDPAAAVGGPQLGDLFSAHRKRHRRFGFALVNLLARAAEHDRALDTLEEFVERYGDDESWSALEWQLSRWSSRPEGRPAEKALDDRGLLHPPGASQQATAFEEVVEMLTATRSWPVAAHLIGPHYLDLLYTVDRVVVADDQIRIDTPVEVPGGSGANTAVGLARLGLPVAVAGIVARDREGTILRRDFVQEGIDYSNLLVVKGDTWCTGHAHIFADRGGRRATYIHPGINERWAVELRREPAALDRLKQMACRSQIVHLSPFYGPAERELQQELITELPADVVVSFDPGTMYSPMGLDRLADFMLRCNILQIYDHQLHTLVANSSAEPLVGFGEQRARVDLQALLRWRTARGSHQPLVVLVKRHRNPGDEGQDPHWFESMMVASGRDSVEELVSPQAPTWRAPLLIDTTGAGDAMTTGLHYGLLRGASVAECADLSYTVAMSCSSEYGCRAGLVSNGGLPDAWERYLPATDVPGWLRGHGA